MSEYSLAVPRCAVCDKLVDSMAMDEDMFARSVTYTVRCHGATESVMLTYSDLLHMTSLAPGVAFATKVLPP